MFFCQFAYTDCLYHFISLEELAESELYICPNCKKRQKSTKKFWIKRLPNVRQFPFFSSITLFFYCWHKSYHHKCRRNTVNFWTHFRSPWHITITGPSESWFRYVSVLSCLFWTQYQQLATMLIFSFFFFPSLFFFCLTVTNSFQYW